MTSPIRLLIVDDDASVREGLTAYFSYAEDIDVVATASDGREALTYLKRNPVDVVLSDVNMPKMGGIELLSHVKQLPKPPTFVAITAMDTDDAMLRMMGGGAAGYVIKSSAPDKIIEAVKDAYEGGTTVSPAALARLVDLVNYTSEVDPKVARTRSLIEELSPTDKRVLDYLCLGLSNSEIAQKTHYAESTVKKHVSHLIAFFDASSRLELVVQVLDARR